MKPSNILLGACWALILWLWIGMLAVEDAQAGSPEISIGMVHYQQPPNGTWYQIGLPHEFSPAPHVWTFGYTGYALPGTRYHLGFASLGGVNNSAVAVSDQAFSSSGMYGCKVDCADKWQFNGSSKLTALYATLAPEWRVANGKVFVEGGAALYHLTLWEEFTKTSGTSLGSIGTTTAFRFSGWRPGFVVGTGVQVGNWQLGLHTYVNRFTAVGDAVPNFGYLITTASVRYIF